MIAFILILLLIISVALAFWSLKRQQKVKEIDFVNRELKKKRVIFDHSSSSDESEE
jgi:cytochrome oxidase assembly protein ShyY1